MKRRKKILNVLTVLILIPVLLLIFIQTPPGKAMLAKALSSALSRSGHLTVNIRGISGWIPMKVGIERLEISDAEGVWFSAENLRCRWVMEEVLQDRISVSRLSADKMVWHRFPVQRERTAPADRKRSGNRMEFIMGRFNVKSLQLEKRIAGVPLSYSVSSGGLRFSADGILAGTVELSGDAAGTVDLQALLNGGAEDYLSIGSDQLKIWNPTFGTDQLTAAGKADISSDGVEGGISLEFEKKGRRGIASTALLYADRKLELSDLNFKHAGISGEGATELLFSDGRIAVNADAVVTVMETNRLEVVGSALVIYSNRNWSVEVGSLDCLVLDSLGLNITGTVSPEEISLVGHLEEMDFGALPFKEADSFSGEVVGNLTVSGTVKEPSVEAVIEVKHLSPSAEVLDELAELDILVRGHIGEGMLSVETAVTNCGSGHLSANAAMPCTFSFLPFSFQTESEQLAGRLDADMDLGIFNRLEMFHNQLIEGQLTTEIDYADGHSDGYLIIENGRYEHYDWGILFRDFNAVFDAGPDGFKVRNASASDGEFGRLEMSGGFGRAGLGLRLNFYNAWILRRDEIEASVSGRIDVSGLPDRPDVTGALTINRADILPDNVLPDPPAVLTDYDRNAPTPVQVAVREGRAPPVGLDLIINMPDQIFVNASMIETVLGGSLHITDAPNGVSVKGTIEPRRGFVSFVGKKFRFTEGQVMLDGSVPTVAVFDNLTAEYSRRDVTARLILNGPVNDPRFRLESSPPMPEDEVLSHVLFNRDSSSISPYQAYQIAMAARQLSGGLSGPGFMFEVRQAVGVDTFEWREAEAAGEASSVAAGKYITSGLYIEVDRSLDARGQTGVKAEFEMGRNFSLETYTGSKERTGVGVTWRQDY